MSDNTSLSIAYKTPKPMKDMDAYVLAMVLRIASTGKTYAERSVMDGVSVLTAHNLPHVAPVFAYFRQRIKENDVKTREEFIDAMPGWGMGVDNWCENHSDLIDKTIRELQEYMDVPAGEYPGRAGFSCWDAGGS